jgi:integrase
VFEKPTVTLRILPVVRGPIRDLPGWRELLACSGGVAQRRSGCRAHRMAQQGARHTYCSCWLRQHGDINKLVLQAGHESAATMWDHYYQAVTTEAAAAFWSIYPPMAEQRRIIAFAE